MDNKSNYEYLLSDLSELKGVGIKTVNLLKKKKINNIFDLLWKLPKAYTDRSTSTKVKDLRIGENQTLIITPVKYLFPRIRNFGSLGDGSRFPGFWRLAPGSRLAAIKKEIRIQVDEIRCALLVAKM